MFTEKQKGSGIVRERKEKLADGPGGAGGGESPAEVQTGLIVGAGGRKWRWAGE